jgi:hypothetical protein
LDEELRNRRHFPRVPNDYALFVRKIDGGSPRLTAKTSQVGLGGLMFNSDLNLGVGSTLYLVMLVGQEPVEAQARVVYELRRERGGYSIGVEFLEVAPRDRVVLERIFLNSPLREGD